MSIYNPGEPYTGAPSFEYGPADIPSGFTWNVGTEANYTLVNPFEFLATSLETQGGYESVIYQFWCRQCSGNPLWQTQMVDLATWCDGQQFEYHCNSPECWAQYANDPCQFGIEWVYSLLKLALCHTPEYECTQCGA